MKIARPKQVMKLSRPIGPMRVLRPPGWVKARGQEQGTDAKADHHREDQDG
jgi:hypothetical protein